jgi:lipopolysaccharide/colanic/teichoic acid biosynthesis glycosyltransferase
MLKRFTDIVVSVVALAVLSPFLLVMALLVGVTSSGGVFFLQERIGRHGRPFRLIKFRTMRPASEMSGLITVGSRDPRITAIGYFLRKYKLDELPQLLNVLGGSMSLVGPRPEVRKYVDLYSAEQRKVLEVKPGLTDYASIEYFSESDLLAAADDPEYTYTHVVMPAKLSLNMKYISEAGFFTDMKILIRTAARIFSGS